VTEPLTDGEALVEPKIEGETAADSVAVPDALKVGETLIELVIEVDATTDCVATTNALVVGETLKELAVMEGEYEPDCVPACEALLESVNAALDEVDAETVTLAAIVLVRLDDLVMVKELLVLAVGESEALWLKLGVATLEGEGESEKLVVMASSVGSGWPMMACAGEKVAPPAQALIAANVAARLVLAAAPEA
jgi:hypothetical protein